MKVDNDADKVEMAVTRLRELIEHSRPGNYYENAEIHDLVPIVLAALESAQRRLYVEDDCDL